MFRLLTKLAPSIDVLQVWTGGILGAATVIMQPSEQSDPQLNSKVIGKKPICEHVDAVVLKAPPLKPPPEKV